MNVIQSCPFLLGHRDETVSRRRRMLCRRVTNIRPTPIDLLRRCDTFGHKGMIPSFSDEISKLAYISGAFGEGLLVGELTN